MKDVRVRFAPSPTGYLHIGGLRTALYNYLFARRYGGKLILRIEDTDRTRLVDDAEDDILQCLVWAGISFDEGPGLGGEFGPYRQSERSHIYQDYASRLVETGHAYYAFDTAEEIDEMRKRHASTENQKYDASTRMEMCNSLVLGEDEVAERISSGEPYVIRLHVHPGHVVTFSDLIRGTVSFDSGTIDDQVLVKSDRLPTYHLANIVDDHLMGVTHVIRGEEWLPSTPKHILLYRALGWNPPQMAHLPLIMSPTGGKLSKRNAEKMGIPVTVKQYREEGYEPDALLNFLAFLGWNPGDESELLDLGELVQAFSLERVGQSGVQFDLNKLKWYNEHYLRQRSAEDVARDVEKLLEAAGIISNRAYVVAIIELMRERISFPSDILESRYFFRDPVAIDEASARKRWKEDSAELVEEYANRIEQLESFDHDTLENVLREIAEERDIGAGRIIHPVRLAVSGVSFGPGLFDLLHILGRETVVRRLRSSARILG